MMDTLTLPRAPARQPRQVATRLRVLTANTHLGQGPKLPYLLRGAQERDRARIELLHDTRAYAFHIAEWLRANLDLYHAVGLQEVFHHALGLNNGARRFRQRDYYSRLAGYGSSIPHRVGFAAFRYENLLLSRLPHAPSPRIQSLLPGRVFRLAACGFTLAPFHLEGRVVWIGNTHLHPYNPRTRAHQAESIAAEIRKLGDVPIVFLGDLNTVPQGCKDGDFPEGERDVRSYRGDRTLSIFAEAGLATVPHADRTEFWTYPTGAPNRTLDYVLFSRHFEVESYRVVKEFTFSDHYPVEAEFRLRA
jgi:endonuclease/exonuclease/phosphatase family metal-dependent hydrolase